MSEAVMGRNTVKQEPSLIWLFTRIELTLFSKALKDISATHDINRFFKHTGTTVIFSSCFPAIGKTAVGGDHIQMRIALAYCTIESELMQYLLHNGKETGTCPTPKTLKASLIDR